MKQQHWNLLVWALWITFAAPWTAWAAFHPLQDAGLAWAMVTNPRTAAGAVQDALLEAYEQVPGANMITAASLGFRPTAKERMAIRRLPTKSATAKSALSPYVLTVRTDHGQYAPGQTVAVELRVRSGAPGWKPTIGAPNEYPTVSIFGPSGEPVIAQTVGQLAGRTHVCEQDAMAGCLAPDDEERGVAYFTPTGPGDYVVTAQVAASWSPPARATVRVHVSEPARGAPERVVSGQVRIGAILLRAQSPASVSRGSPVDVAISLRNTGASVWCPDSWNSGGLMVVVRRGARTVAQSPFTVTVPDPIAWHGFDVQGQMEGCLSPGHTVTLRATWTAHVVPASVQELARGEPPVPAGRFAILVGRGIGGFGSMVGVHEAETVLPLEIK
jgi:hypothetical protein